MAAVTIEDLRRIEAELGPERVTLVCERLKREGWRDPRDIPLWVWNQAYADELSRPAAPEGS